MLSLYNIIYLSILSHLYQNFLIKKRNKKEFMINLITAKNRFNKNFI